MSIILAIETSADLASAALMHGTELTWRESAGVQTHSQSILPLVQELLAQAGIGLKQCDAIAFGSGPGSFTGVRTACGIVQGLAYGAGVQGKWGPLVVRGEYERINAGGGDPDLLSLGAIWRF